MKKTLLFILISLTGFAVRAQFPAGSDTLRNFNNRFIDNNSQKAFTNLRLHNLLAGMINHMDSIAVGASVNLGMDTAFMSNDSLFTYRKGGVFRQFIIRGTGGLLGSGEIYRIPFNNGLGRFVNDSNFKFDKSVAEDASRLIVGPTAISGGGYAKINATSDNMNALALTSYGTGINTIIARRARGSIASPTGLLNTDDLFNLSGRGHTGTDFTTSSRAAIYAQTTQDWTDTTQGTKIELLTTPLDEVAGVVQMRISDSTEIRPVIAASADSIAAFRDGLGNGLSALIKIPAASIGSVITASNGLTKTGNNITPGGSVASSFTWTVAASERINIASTSGSAFGGIQAVDDGTGNAILALQSNNDGDAITGFHTGSGTGVFGLSATGSGVIGRANDAGNGVSAYSETGIPTLSQSNQAGTTNSQTIFHAIRTNPASGGVPGSGFGSHILFDAENDAEAATVNQAAIHSIWSSSAAGSESANLDFHTIGSGVIDNKFRIKGDGQLQATKYITAGSFTTNDTTTYKPVAIDATGNIYRMDAWRGSGTPTTPGIDDVLAVNQPLLNGQVLDIDNFNLDIFGSAGNVLVFEPTEVYSFKNFTFGSEAYFEIAGGVLPTNVPIVNTATSHQTLVVDTSTGQIQRMMAEGFAQTATGTVSNTTSETTLISSGVGSLVIPASAWVVGKSYRVRISGYLSTDGATPATTNFRLKLGSTTIATTGGLFQGTGVSNRAYEADIVFTARTVSSSGTIMTMGLYKNDNDGIDKFDNAASTSTIDMTASQTIDLTIQMNNTGAGNVVNVYVLTFEAIN